MFWENMLSGFGRIVGMALATVICSLAVGYAGPTLLKWAGVSAHSCGERCVALVVAEP